MSGTIARSMWMKLAAALGVALMCVGMTPDLANAREKVSWWRTTAVSVSGYGSTGYGYGSFKVTNYPMNGSGTRAEVHGRIRINNADNHRVYLTNNFQSNAGNCVAPTYTSCSQSWYHHATVDSTKVQDSSYRNTYPSVAADSGASYMRARVKVCLDIPWRTDPCTGYYNSDGDST
jgi:hypothetical protein